MNTILITSGFLQMILAVSLGWVMTGFYKTPDVVGPFKSSKRVLQAHIDNILMALLQFAIAAVHPEIPMIAGLLILFGSWVNPQLFLVMAAADDLERAAKSLRLITLVSFAALTIAYPWLLISFLLSGNA
jgi:hydroxylaminobenzene mutase